MSDDFRLVHGKNLGVELCRVLNIEPGAVRAITLRCAVDEAATVILEQYVMLDGKHTEERFEKTYNLVEVESEPADG